MPAYSPDIAQLDKGGFFQSSRQIKIIVLRSGIILFLEQVGDLLFLKPSQRYIKCLCLQSLDLDTQQFFIPPGIHSHTVVCQDVCFLLGFGQIVHIDTRHFLDAFLTSRKDSSMSGDHIQIPVYNDRIDKPELPQAGTKFVDLFS